MRWQLSDGTVVTSDGTQITVQGSTPFAAYLRQHAVEPALLVPVYPEPGGDVRLDPSNALVIDCCLKDEIRHLDVDILVSERPEVEPLPDPGPGVLTPDGSPRVY